MGPASGQRQAPKADLKLVPERGSLSWSLNWYWLPLPGLVLKVVPNLVHLVHLIPVFVFLRLLKKGVPDLVPLHLYKLVLAPKEGPDLVHLILACWCQALDFSYHVT